jgi:AraC-like DNA-binding protein
MEPSLNTWTLIFLVASFQGFILSLFLWKSKNHQNRIVSGIVLCFSVILLFYVTYWTKYLTLLPRSVGAVQGLTYVTGPLFLAFVRGHRPLDMKWHFAPFLLFLTYFFIWPLLPGPYQSEVVTGQVISQAVHLIIYSLLSLHYAMKINCPTRKINSGLYSIYSFSFLAYYILVWTGALRIEYDYLISIAACGCIYFIGYSSFRQPDESSKPKYDKSGLSESAAEAILAEIKSYMEGQKGYLNNELKLHQLAEELSISANHISQVINELEGRNFKDFVNRYRIEEAKKLILDSTNTYKIIQIAYLSGFNNKATFNSAFKKFVGTQPSQFKNQNSAHT